MGPLPVQMLRRLMSAAEAWTLRFDAISSTTSRDGVLLPGVSTGKRIQRHEREREREGKRANR